MAERSVGRLRVEASDPALEELRERVADRFRAVGATAGALQARVRAASDWRGVAKRHPAWALGTAAGLGLLTAALVRRSRRPRADQKAGATLEWLARFPYGPRRPRALASLGAPALRGAFGLLASMVVRRLSRRLKDELLKSQLPPPSRLVSARPGPA